MSNSFRYVKLWISLIGLSACFFSHVGLAHGDEDLGWYTVEKGDTLPMIAISKMDQPSHPEGGRLKKLLRMNPGLSLKVPLKVGQRIKVGFGFEEAPDGTLDSKEIEAQEGKGAKEVKAAE